MNLDSFYNKLWSIKESIKDDIKSVGDYLQYITPMVFIIYSACFLDNHVSRVFVCAFAAAMIIMSLLKALFNAPRPRETQGTDNPDLDLDWSPDEGNSFVSGHTASSLMGGIFWFQINEWMGLLGIALGLFTGLSRIIAKAHWLRDVIGAIILDVAIYVICVLYFL